MKEVSWEASPLQKSYGLGSGNLAFCVSETDLHCGCPSSEVPSETGRENWEGLVQIRTKSNNVSVEATRAGRWRSRAKPEGDLQLEQGQADCHREQDK